MNSAARLINDQVQLPVWQWISIKTTKVQCAAQALMLMILLSAIAVVYVTNQTRNAYHELQRSQNHQHELNIQYGQLELEKGTWGTQARIERVAETKLHMQVPSVRSVIVVE